MRRRGQDFWWIFLLLIILGSSEMFPLVLILGVVLAITYFSVKQSNQEDSTRNRRTTSSRKTSARAQRKLSSSEIAKINVALRRYFQNNEAFTIGDYKLALSGDRYTTFDQLDVFRNDQYLYSFGEMASRNSRRYDALLEELAHFASVNPGSNRGDVIDVEVTEHVEPVQKKTETAYQSTQARTEKKQKEVSRSQAFIDQINDLNNSLPDQDISNSLYQTTSLLSQIQQLEKKFPDSKNKLDKLYDHYLPILVNILEQFNRLQNVKTDPSYAETKEKLTKTIDLINDAMSSIISSMSDQDFINLSADMSTLEAVLQKDGYSGQTTMHLNEESKN